MDAFAVSVCKGICVKNIRLMHPLVIGLYFGSFQAVMPLAGYSFGALFENKIKSLDHWISFFLLFFIGVNFIRESRESFNIDKCENFLSLKSMIPLAIATSIDALAVGITFLFSNINIYVCSLIIGVITFIMSIIGFKIGNIFGLKLKNKSELLGGIILILIGTKILFEHLEIIKI